MVSFFWGCCRSNASFTGQGCGNLPPSSKFSCVQGVDQAQLKQAKKLILELLHERKPHPLMIRLAWHDSGTYDKVLW